MPRDCRFRDGTDGRRTKCLSLSRGSDGDEGRQRNITFLIATAVLNCVQGDYASAGLEYVLLMIMKYTPFIRKTVEVGEFGSIIVFSQ